MSRRNESRRAAIPAALTSWPRRGLWGLALIIAAFACWCVVLVMTQRDLQDQLEARRGWFRDVNAVQHDLHQALPKSDGRRAECVKRANERLVCVERQIAADPGVNPDVALMLSTHSALIQALPAEQPVSAAHAEALSWTDELVNLARIEMQRVQRGLDHGRRTGRAVLLGALALACIALVLLYRCVRSHGHIAELNARRTLDAEDQETRRLESMGLLAGGVAHDFNNLLVGVIGNADLARELVPRDSPARECIDEISASALRCAELSRQILAYCGRGRLRVESTDLNALLEDVALEVRGRLPEGTELKLHGADDLPPIEVDAGRIRQVLAHVMTNACEALGPSGGKITLRAGVRHFERKDLEHYPGHERLREGRYATVEVTDDGCGMDEHTLARVFDPFFTTKAENRGFGMAVVSGLVRAHRGAVMAESAPGGGATVRILLPMGEVVSDDLAIDVEYGRRVPRGRPRRATG